MPGGLSALHSVRLNRCGTLWRRQAKTPKRTPRPKTPTLKLRSKTRRLKALTMLSGLKSMRKVLSFLILASACLLAGCAGSTVSSETPALRITPLPASVYVEANRVTPAPAVQGLSPRALATLTVSLRRSELRKVRALKAAIKSHEQQRGYIAKRGKPQKGKRK